MLDKDEVVEMRRAGLHGMAAEQYGVEEDGVDESAYEGTQVQVDKISERRLDARTTH